MLNKLFIKFIQLILPFLVTTKRKCKIFSRNELYEIFSIFKNKNKMNSKAFLFKS